MVTVHSRFGVLILSSLATASAAPARPQSATADLPLAVERALLIPSDAAAGDSVGSTIALSDNTAVVGAPLNASSTGAAYVFIRTGSSWTQQAKLTASDGGSSHRFGVSVAIVDDTILVGASQAPVGAIQPAGAVYVFTRTGTTWSEQAKLTASDPGQFDAFGADVALDGDTALVGTLAGDAPAAVNAGAAYVFARSGSVWTEQAKLTASDAATIDHFGRSVALDGDTALVGAPRRALGRMTTVGAAYVFVRSGTAWSEQQMLAISDPLAGAEAGSSVAVDGDTAVIGAHFYSPPGTPNAGRAFVFTRAGSSWAEQAVLVPSGPDHDIFGVAVDIDGDRIAVGASQDGHSGVAFAGSADIFERVGSSWTRRCTLYANAPEQSAAFGLALALEGDRLVVGAPSDQPVGTSPTGSARVFLLSALDAFCFGDGSLGTPCPCAPPDVVPSPSGGSDAGCANSFDLNGARLAASGSLNTAFRLHAYIAPSYANFAFAFKGNAQDLAGVASGDGVRCASGPLVRFGGHNAGTNGAPIGEWTYPNSAQTTSIVASTNQPAASLAVYQVLYRNAAAGFCSPATYNVTNAVRVTWP